MKKVVICDDLFEATVSCIVSRVLSHQVRDVTERIIGVLKYCIDMQMGTVRILILSEGTWRDADVFNVEYHTDNIRTFKNSLGLKCLEFLVHEMNTRDMANVHGSLLWALAIRVLVFRLSNVNGLKALIAISKEITDRFSGLTSDQERISFVDCHSTGEFENNRHAIQDLAMQRRFNVAYKNKGRSGKALESVVGIINGEFLEEEA